MDVQLLVYACIFASALLTSLLLTPFAGRLATRLGAVDRPSKRRINTVSVPRMGGVAVAGGMVVALVVQYVGTLAFAWPTAFSTSASISVNYRLLALAFAVVFATGVVDDVCTLKPLPKLVGQVLGASVAVAGGLVIGRIVNPFAEGELALGWVAYPVTVAYLVAYTNIINLIDGLDGLASGITCISAATMAALAWLAGRMDAAALSVAVCGATLGFLRHNFHPASIFLGDSGALLLGFSLGTISLLNVTRIAGLTTILIPLVISAVPIIDTFSAIVRRRRAHVSVGQADKGHLHHRLVLQQGYDQRQAVLFIYLWTALLCVGAIVMTQVNVGPRIAIFVVLVAGSLVLALKLHLFEPVLRHHYNPVTDEDELVAPGDPGFAEEEARAESRRECLVEEIQEKLRL